MFLYNLARQGSVIYPREAVDQQKSQPIGTGPFMLERWDRGDRIVLKRNPEYHVKGLPKLDRVTFRFIPDANAALAALQAGDIDVMAFGLGPESVEVVRRTPTLQLIQGETTNDVILALNNGKKPFSDVRVRRAITHAIDKAEIVKGAMFGFGRVLGSNVDPLNPYFVDMAKAVPHDLARAKQLLAEAGYPNGFEAVLKVPPQYPYTVRTGEVLVGQLAKVGVRVKLEQIEWGQWLDRVYKNADYDMTIIGHAEAWDAGNYANPKYYYRYDSARFQEVYGASESDARRQEAPRAVRAAPEDHGRRGPGGLAVRLPAAGGGQEGRPGDLEGPADSLAGSLGGRLGEVAPRAAVPSPAAARPGAFLGAAPSRASLARSGPCAG